MADSALLPGNWPTPAQDSPEQAFALAQQVQCIISVAHGLVAGGRCVDLTGLDRSIGLLCARALDLPPAQGRMIRIELLNLARELDGLTATVRDKAA